MWTVRASGFEFPTTIHQLAGQAAPLRKYQSQRLEYRDIEQPGLVLRVGYRTKTYYLFRRVKLKSGRPKEVKIRLGSIEEIHLTDARLRAREAMQTMRWPRPNVDEFFPNEELLTTQEAACITKMSVAWYEKKRWEGSGPPYRKRGRAVRYVKSELLGWWLARERP